MVAATETPTDPPAVATAGHPDDGVDWPLLRRIAADPRVKATLRSNTTADRKPTADEKERTCEACPVRCPGGRICGYCRGRVGMIRRTTGAGVRTLPTLPAAKRVSR